MVRHPTPKQLAKYLRSVANIIDNHGNQAVDLAAILAARGWPTSTIGDGTGSRTTTELTTVEAAAARDRWADIDERLAKLLRFIWKASLDIETTITDIVAHASDADITPAGTGSCVACQRLCRPTNKRAHDRLRSGLCPACHQAWLRYRQHDADRHSYLTWRRQTIAAANERAARGQDPTNLFPAVPTVSEVCAGT